MASRLSRRARSALGLFSGGVLVLLGLFVWNGVEPSWRTPEEGVTAHPARELPGDLHVMAYNLQKAGFHHGGLSFAAPEVVRARLDAIAELVREREIDLLFVSEIVLEAAPCPVDQVEYLARAGGFHAWVYGDNYSWGIPGCRIRSGNAVLSRFPLRGTRVQELPGPGTFWNPLNRRRLVWAEVLLGERWVPCASVRNDSFDLANNARQVDEILRALGDEGALLAGDFNAEPRDPPMRSFRSSGLFEGVFDGAPTFPASSPRRRIDTILVPRSLGQVVEERVLDVDLSDHEPVEVLIRLASARR